MSNNKDIQTILRNRLSHKLFLEIFLRPASGYKLAQIVQNTTKTPNTKSVYRVLKNLTEQDYVIYENQKYHHNPTKLTKELVTYLKSKDISFTSNETNSLLYLLSSTRFFIYFREFIAKDNQKNKISNNVLEEISNIVGMFSAILYHGMETSVSKPLPVKISLEKAFERQTIIANGLPEKISKIVRGSKSERKAQQKYLEELYLFLLSFSFLFVVQEKIPKKSLEKFAQLWDQYEGFKIGIRVGKIDFKNNPLTKLFDSKITK
ncbi:MAG: hypothetical protein K8Q89_09570 [Nitrosarchaeum sp.]|nr:hypothetical protein [Nitrosarchaeum sp.]